jgi:hypothetical protein
LGYGKQFGAGGLAVPFEACEVYDFAGAVSCVCAGERALPDALLASVDLDKCPLKCYDVVRLYRVERGGDRVVGGDDMDIGDMFVDTELGGAFGEARKGGVEEEAILLVVAKVLEDVGGGHGAPADCEVVGG